MSLPRIILIGGGGHCISCIDVIKSTGKYDIAGILDVKEKVGTKILDVPVIGTDDELPAMKSNYDFFLVTIGQIKSPDTRIRVFERMQQLGLKSPVIISPNAYVSASAKVGDGTIIMHGAVVNAATSIGKNCIINTKAILEHEVVVEDHSHISTAAVCNGNVTVGSGSFVGSNATIRQGVFIGERVIVGAGAVVLNDISSNTVLVGNPASIK